MFFVVCCVVVSFLWGFVGFCCCCFLFFVFNELHLPFIQIPAFVNIRNSGTVENVYRIHSI